MNGVTVRRKVRFGTRPAKPAAVGGNGNPGRVSRAARMLALAYYVERAIDEGRIESYAEAARILRVSRARMAQVIGLLSLPAGMQEAILGGEALSERSLRR